VATAAGAPGVLGLGPALAVALVVGYAGELAIQVVRRRTSAEVERRRVELESGDPGTIGRIHGHGLARDAVRALVVTALGLLLAALVRRYLPLSLRATVLLATVAVGAAVAAAATGALRLSGKAQGRAWLAAGMLAGMAWVALQ
jgi:hypothetical protein